MAKSFDKFKQFMIQKREKIIIDYQNALYERYPILSRNDKLYNNLEPKFAKEHLDLKEEFYRLDCACKLLDNLDNCSLYSLLWDLLIAFVDLKWLEDTLNEFSDSIIIKANILKYILKYVLEFYDRSNVRFYNLTTLSFENAKNRYRKGQFDYFPIQETLEILKTANLDEPNLDFLKKEKVCLEAKKIIAVQGMQALFNESKKLEALGFSSSFANELQSYYLQTNACDSCKNNVIVTPKVNLNSSKEKDFAPKIEVDRETLQSQMKKFMVDAEFVDVIEGEKLQEFLNIASQLYSAPEIYLLKEKLIANNSKLKESRRREATYKIIHEEDREYYFYLYSIDLTDSTYLPYSFYISNTLHTIDTYIEDIEENPDDVLVELYLEETRDLLANMRICLPQHKREC